MTRRGRLLVAWVAGLLLAPGAGRGADPAAALFLDQCASCHTVGGGDLDGPDLEEATGWPRGDLRQAVERMEEDYVGPLGEEQVLALLDLLQDPRVERRLSDAAELASSAWAEDLAAAEPATGRRLFFGEVGLAAGGMGCFACHAVGDRGGSLASDLTGSWGRLGASSVLSAIERPSFPLMRAAYGARPLTREETAHLAVYLQQAAAAAPAEPAAGAAGESLGPLLIGALLLAVAVFLAVALVSRGRGRSVRSQLTYAPARR